MFIVTVQTGHFQVQPARLRMPSDSIIPDLSQTPADKTVDEAWNRQMRQPRRKTQVEQEIFQVVDKSEVTSTGAGEESETRNHLNVTAAE